MIIHCNTLDSYSEWSSDEIQHLEEGLREYGKDFYKICVYKVIINVTFFVTIIKICLYLLEFLVSKSECSGSYSLLLSMEEK